MPFLVQCCEHSSSVVVYAASESDESDSESASEDIATPSKPAVNNTDDKGAELLLFVCL